MSTTEERVGSDDVTSFPCRRRRVRHDLTWALVYVDFGALNGGIVLNLSEDGFSVQAAVPLAAESFFSVRFKGGREGGCIEVGCRLVWMSNTRKTAGFQFIDISESARKQIAGWMALEVSPQQDNQRARNDWPQATNRAPSSRDLCCSPGRVPQPEMDHQLSSPLPGEPNEDRGHRQSGKLPYLVPVEASAFESGFSRRSDQRMSASDGASGSSDRSGGALNEVEALLKSQRLGFQAPGRSQGNLPRPPGVRAPLRYSSAPILPVFLLAALIFAAGFALGHIRLDRPSNGAGKVAASELTAARSPAPATAVDNRTVALSGANTPPLNRPVNALEPIATPPVTPRVLAEPTSSHTGDAVSQVSQGSLLLSAKSYREQPAQPAEQSINTPGSGPSESLGPTQTQMVQMPVQHVPPEGDPPSQSAHSESALSTASVSDVSSPGTVSGISPGASGTPGKEGPLEETRMLATAPPGQIDPCHLIHAVQPVYPREAKQQHLEGNVELRVLVGSDGTVRSVKLVSGLPLLASAAMDAARGFRYSPALLNGQPIETIQTVDISFRLKR